MPRNIIRLGLLPLLVAACDDPRQPTQALPVEPLRVRTQAVEPSVAAPVEHYSGIVKAHRETRISSEIAARILHRHVVAGQAVRTGTALFTLDTQDLDAMMGVARAEREAAQAEREVAGADLQRWEQLAARNAASAQALDQARRAYRASIARVEAAEAQLTLAQVRHARAVVRAPFDGVIVRIDAEEGQLAQVNAPLAVLVDNGRREVEVYLPGFLSAPQQVVIQAAGRPPLQGEWIESEGALEAASKTRRARYRLPLDNQEAGDRASPASTLPLESVVTVQVALSTVTLPLLRVPVGAIDERGGGPQVWIIVDGKATATPVQLVSLWGDSAVVAAELALPARVISIGTHRLSAGVVVQELAP